MTTKQLLLRQLEVQQELLREELAAALRQMSRRAMASVVRLEEKRDLPLSEVAGWLRGGNVETLMENAGTFDQNERLRRLLEKELPESDPNPSPKES